MKFEIKHKRRGLPQINYHGEVLFEAEVGSMKLCVELAVKSKANLSNADLSNANLSNANLSNADLWNADLSNANLRNANLSNADLSNANLSNADLWNADLWNADIRNAKTKNCCYICAGVGGNHGRPIMCNPEEDLVQAGCFKGTSQDFKKQVANKYGKDYGSYKGVVAYLDAVNAKGKEWKPDVKERN